MTVVNMLLWFLIIVFITFVARHLYRIVPRGIQGFLSVLAVFGVFIHELGHTFMCVVCGFPVQNFSVRYYDQGVVAPHGGINIPEEKLLRASFLQLAMVSFGPLIFSTWLFLICLDFFAYHTTDLLVKILLIFVMISISMTANPSHQDIRMLFWAYGKNPRYSWYQIGLVSLAFLIVYFGINLSMIQLPMEVLYYIIGFFMVIGIYFVLKYGFRLLYSAYSKIRPKRKPSKRVLIRTRNSSYHPLPEIMEEDV
jgi:hypothetical protein